MKICKKLQKLLAVVFVTTLIVTSIQMPSYAAAEEAKAENGNLVNIASDCIITVPSAERPAENMVDGDETTLWVQNGEQWPSTVSFQLPADNTKRVKKVVVKFEKGHTPWSVDVTLSHALNNVTSDLIVDDVKANHSFDDTYEFVYDVPLNFTHTYITLSNPMNNGSAGAFWPAIAEVQILVEEESEESSLINVAPNAIVTSVGGNAGNKSALVDENYSSLYVFNNGGMSTIQGDAWIELALDREYPVSAMEAAFELADPDSNNFHFTFDVFGKGKNDTEWQTLFAGVEATRLTGDNIKEMKLDAVKNLKNVRIVVRSITSSGGDPWPALAEFKVFADVSGSDAADTESIAYKKPVHTNAGQATISRVNDGSTTNVWSGDRYPAYIDIDLEKNYNLDEIQIFTPGSGYSQYSIYTSMNGRDFDKLAEKTSKDSCPEEGESYKANGKEARIVRVYVEYQSTSSRSMVNEIRVLGEESATEVIETPAVEVEDYEGSKYDVEITKADTVAEVQGIIERRLGAEYIDWFSFELAAGGEYDYFELSQNGGKIHIKGNNGVSLATGLNHYLKYYCNVNISQVGDQADMPETIVPIEGTVHKETKFPVRYSYNYCTLSYSMAFWGEEEWRNELDWLALNGVNVVLDATAQEEVWRRFLGKLGYTHQEAKDYIAGPAYYAWAYMANLSGFGGPVHDSWFTERTELARKNQLAMRKLGMQPVLQGYSGMVPVDIKDKDSEAEVISQGLWCSFQRPSMLKTDSAVFDKYAALFYQAQKEVYGDVSDYYATDPFHEGGNKGGMSEQVIARKVLASMMEADVDAIWIIQSWQGNPTTALLQGLEGARDHALVLDLYAEKTPHWNETNPNAYGGGEFLNTPWVYCMLNNFGGRLGLHGHIENFVEGIANAAAKANHMAGIGITPEASVNNPVLYDLFFETIWTEDSDNLPAINLDEWFKDYATRRYGAESEAAYEAMQILNETVYNPALNMKGQGAPESVVNARPRLDINAASTWGNAVIDYDKAELERAAALLLEDYEKLKDSAGYQYDLANVLEQILSNTAQEYQKKMSSAFREGNAEKFERMSDLFLGIITKVEEVTGTQEEFMLGTWVEAAKALAANADDFTKELYELNARGLITTWGSIDQANSGGLIDYSNRQWAGLTNDYYKMRWEKWIAERKKELAGESFVNYSNADWFEMEWAWARSNNEYPTEPNGMDLRALGEEILETYSVTNIPKDPAENDEFDIPTEGMTATSGSEQATSGSEGPASNVLDGNTNTIWHSVWAGTGRENLWIDIALPQAQSVNGMRVLPRSEGGTNGIITEYRIEVSADNGATYTEVASGTWSSGSSWQLAQFDEVEATNVRLWAVNSLSGESGKNFASAAEIRLTQPKAETPDPMETDKSDLEALFTYAGEQMAKDAYASVIPAVRTALEAKYQEAEAILADNTVSQEEVNQVYKELLALVHMLDFIGGDNKPLQILVKEVEDIYLPNIDNYTEETAAALQNAYNEALKVLEDGENALAGDIEAARTALQKAKDELVEKEVITDKSRLEQLVAQAEGILAGDTGKYTEESVATLTSTLAVGQAVLENKDASQGLIDAAADTLEAAINGLSEKAPEKQPADKSALIALYEEVKDTDVTNYTDGSVNLFQAALNAAAEVIANDTLTEEDQDVVDRVKDTLQAAFDGLTLKETPGVEKDALKKLIDKSVQYVNNEAIYTEESFAIFKAAYDAALMVYNDEAATQEEVDAARATLEAARRTLREIPNKDKLEELIGKIKEVDLSLYTAKTAKAVKAAYAKAMAVFEDENATQVEIDEAVKALEKVTKEMKAGKKAAAGTQNSDDNKKVASDNSGKTSTTNSKNQSGSVKTGDDSAVIMILMLFGMSAAAIAMAKKKKAI